MKIVMTRTRSRPLGNPRILRVVVASIFSPHLTPVQRLWRTSTPTRPKTALLRSSNHNDLYTQRFGCSGQSPGPVYLDPIKAPPWRVNYTQTSDTRALITRIRPSIHSHWTPQPYFFSRSLEAVFAVPYTDYRVAWSPSHQVETST